MSYVLLCGAVTLALNRNFSCNAGALQGVEAPYAGQLLPRNARLIEYWNQGWQWTKQIDVFDPAQNMSKVGQFYDMNFLFFFRFGYSDVENRIWFEAKRPWFRGASNFGEWWSRKFVFNSEHFYIQRCDGDSTIYDVDEDTSQRPWWCQDHCMKVFDLFKQDPSGKIPEARVHFNYSLEWYFNGFRTREAWNMNMYDPSTKAPIAHAHQTFTLKNYFLSYQQRWISHWQVNIQNNETNLPDWVIGFMTALDDIDEASEEGKQH